MSMARKRGWGITHAWSITIAFFAGSVVSLSAFDLSDYANYAAQSSGRALDSFQQVFYFALFPTLLYGVLAIAAFLLAKTSRIKPAFFFWFFLVFIVLVPSFAAFLLPQAADTFFLLTVGLGMILSVIIVIGMLGAVTHHQNAFTRVVR